MVVDGKTSRVAQRRLIGNNYSIFGHECEANVSNLVSGKKQIFLSDEDCMVDFSSRINYAGRSDTVLKFLNDIFGLVEDNLKIRQEVSSDERFEALIYGRKYPSQPEYFFRSCWADFLLFELTLRLVEENSETCDKSDFIIVVCFLQLYVVASAS